MILLHLFHAIYWMLLCPCISIYTALHIMKVSYAISTYISPNINLFNIAPLVTLLYCVLIFLAPICISISALILCDIYQCQWLILQGAFAGGVSLLEGSATPLMLYLVFFSLYSAWLNKGWDSDSDSSTTYKAHLTERSRYL